MQAFQSILSIPITSDWPVPSATKYAPSTRRGNWFIVANLPEPISAASAVHCHQKSWGEWPLETFSALLDLLGMRFRWVNTDLDHPTSCKHGFKFKDCNSDIATFWHGCFFWSDSTPPSHLCWFCLKRYLVSNYIEDPALTIIPCFSLDIWARSWCQCWLRKWLFEMF